MPERRPTHRVSGCSWSNPTAASVPPASNQSWFLRPADTCEITVEPTIPESVSNMTVAMSSVSTARGAPSPSPRSNERASRRGRSAWATAVRALSDAIRWPETNSIRSHQCEPMSAKAREGPPSAGSTRQLSSDGASSQSWR